MTANRSPQRRIHEAYIAFALFYALTAGFGFAAILVIALAFGFPPGPWWTATVQAHGHAQLFGWTGLFVLGVGLFFIPRLRGTVLANPELAPLALTWFVVGIGLRALLQPLLAIYAASYVSPPAWKPQGEAGLVVAAAFEAIGALLIVYMLNASFRRARPLGPEAPIRPVRIFLALAMISLVASVLVNLFLAADTAARGTYLYSATWDDALTHLMIMGFMVPITMALSIRNMPLFMRLAFPPREGLRPLLVIFTIGLVSRLAGSVAQTFSSAPDLPTRLMGGGDLLEGAALLAFIWMIDIPLRRKRPWTDSRIPTPPEVAAARKPTRKGYPDYGEYGRFELLIISAYLWLAFGALIAIVNGLASLFSSSIVFNPDIERHSITVGFITLLIFGMAARMVPGFSGKMRVASTRLVLATIWLGNLAALFRVAPLFKPDWPIASMALGSSGILGWAAVACLAVNLWKTFRSLEARK